MAVRQLFSLRRESCWPPIGDDGLPALPLHPAGPRLEHPLTYLFRPYQIVRTKFVRYHR